MCVCVGGRLKNPWIRGCSGRWYSMQVYLAGLAIYSSQGDFAGQGPHGMGPTELVCPPLMDPE